jgi:hypothetical protein
MNPAMTSSQEPQILASLCDRLTQRGTHRNRRTKWAGARDWRYVAARYLRRFVGGEWHVGGHHVGRLDFKPGAIGARVASRKEAAHARALDDGRRAIIEIVR